MDIYCFGDSITLGEYDTERGGWDGWIKMDAATGAGSDKNVHVKKYGSAPNEIFKIEGFASVYFFWYL